MAENIEMLGMSESESYMAAITYSKSTLWNVALKQMHFPKMEVRVKCYSACDQGLVVKRHSLAGAYMCAAHTYKCREIKQQQNQLHTFSSNTHPLL